MLVNNREGVRQVHMYAPYSRLKFGLATTAIHTRVQRLVTEHMQVPFSVTQGRYLLAQVLAYIQSLTAVP